MLIHTLGPRAKTESTPNTTRRASSVWVRILSQEEPGTATPRGRRLSYLTINLDYAIHSLPTHSLFSSKITSWAVPFDKYSLFLPVFGWFQHHLLAWGMNYSLPMHFHGCVWMQIFLMRSQGTRNNTEETRLFLYVWTWSEREREGKAGVGGEGGRGAELQRPSPSDSHDRHLSLKLFSLCSDTNMCWVFAEPEQCLTYGPSVL